MKKQSNINWVKNNNWRTPQYLIDYIQKHFFNWNDYFDPCPYNPDYEIDWLTLDWGEYTYCNPPYTRSDKEKLIIKTYEEYKKWKTIALLIPSATETQIFHKYIYPYAQVYLLEKRVQFIGYNSKWEYVTNKTWQSWSALCIFDNKILPFIKPLTINK